MRIEIALGIEKNPSAIRTAGLLFDQVCTLKSEGTSKRYAYIIEELMYTDTNYSDKATYFDQILAHLLDLEQGRTFIIALCQSIQRLVVDHLHVVGDIYDRGPEADKIMDKLCPASFCRYSVGKS